MAKGERIKGYEYFCKALYIEKTSVLKNKKEKSKLRIG